MKKRENYEVNNPLCNDTRPCCFRNRNTYSCRILTSTYKKDSDCKFCKKNCLK